MKRYVDISLASLALATILVPYVSFASYGLLGLISIGLVSVGAYNITVTTMLFVWAVFCVSKSLVFSIIGITVDIIALFKAITLPFVLYVLAQMSPRLAYRTSSLIVVAIIAVGVFQVGLSSVGVRATTEIAPPGTMSSANISMAVSLTLVLAILLYRGRLRTQSKLFFSQLLVFQSAASLPTFLHIVWVGLRKISKRLLLLFLGLTAGIFMVRVGHAPLSDIFEAINAILSDGKQGHGSLLWRVWAWNIYIDNLPLEYLPLGGPFGLTSKVSPLFGFDAVGQDPHNSFIIMIFEYGFIGASFVVPLVYMLCIRGYMSSLSGLSRLFATTGILILLFFGNAMASKEMFVALGLLAAVSVRFESRTKPL